MDFKLVKDVDIQTLDEWPTWGQYYEPSDVDSLVGCGYDRKTVCTAIEAVEWSDEYWFPIPDGTPPRTFKFEYRKALFRTPSGAEIPGYVFNSGLSIGLFGRDDIWIINEDLLDLFEEEKTVVLNDLQIENEANFFPLEFHVEALGGLQLFPRAMKA